MYYELYIDVLFLENFMLDSLLLFAVNCVMKCGRSFGRIILGGAAGRALTCLVIALPLPAAVKLIFYHVVINSLMILAALKIKSAAQFIKAFILVYLSAFAAGGFLQILQPYIRYAGLFYAVAVGSGFLFAKAWKLVSRMLREEQNICRVTLYVENRKYSIRALWDTGNRVTDPVTGEPVSILAQELAGTVFGKDETGKGFRYIPYRYVGGEGIMKVCRADRMCVDMDGERWVENPLLGVGEAAFSETEEYQMILNPEVFR